MDIKDNTSILFNTNIKKIIYKMYLLKILISNIIISNSIYCHNRNL